MSHTFDRRDWRGWLACMVLIAVGFFALGMLLRGTGARAAELVAEPPGVMNPAVTQENIATTICVPNWAAKQRPPASYTNRLKAKQLGVPLKIRRNGKRANNPALKRWEEDHHYCIACGGNPRDPGNLRPQLWTGVCNAHHKDRLEVAIHKALCRGEMKLIEVPGAFDNWRGTYRRLVDPKGCGD